MFYKVKIYTYVDDYVIVVYSTMDNPISNGLSDPVYVLTQEQIAEFL